MTARGEWSPAFRLKLGLELDQTLERFEKILEGQRWQHDCVTPSSYILGNLEEASASIFF